MMNLVNDGADISVQVDRHRVEGRWARQSLWQGRFVVNLRSRWSLIQDYRNRLMHAVDASINTILDLACDVGSSY